MDRGEIEKLYKVRELAGRKEGCEGRIGQLREQLQETQALHMRQDENGKTVIGGSRYILISVAVYIVSALILNKAASVVIRMALDGIPFGMAVETALSADVNPLVGMVLAVPVALAAALAVKAALRKGDKKRNSQNRETNRIGELENQRIRQQNAAVEEQNRQIQEQIAGIEEEAEEVLKEFHTVAPWYPEAYFNVFAVDCMIRRLESGEAESLDQAIVHYEAGLR